MQSGILLEIKAHSSKGAILEKPRMLTARIASRSRDLKSQKSEEFNLLIQILL